MKPDNLDADTNKVLTDAEEVRNLTHSRGWAVIHAKLVEKILDLQNINNIDAEKPETLTTQLLGRKLASDLLYGWLKADVFGAVEQADAAKMPEEAPEGYIGRQ